MGRDTSAAQLDPKRAWSVSGSERRRARLHIGRQIVERSARVDRQPSAASSGRRSTAGAALPGRSQDCFGVHLVRHVATTQWRGRAWSVERATRASHWNRCAPLGISGDRDRDRGAVIASDGDHPIEVDRRSAGLKALRRDPGKLINGRLGRTAGACRLFEDSRPVEAERTTGQIILAEQAQSFHDAPSRPSSAAEADGPHVPAA